VYGHSKLAGERIVTSLLSRFYIVRAGWMIGGGPKEKKFVGMLLRQLDDGSRALRAVDDKLGTPTYARDLAVGIHRLLESGYYGLYHMVNGGAAVSRYDVARAMLDLLGRDDVTLEPVGSDAFPLPAPRARSEAMVNYKLQLLGIDPMPPWRDALASYLGDELGR
jgi:dTDP-4-dehydrorhamnose reductase